MTGNQSASQSTPGPDTVYRSVEVSRPSWIVGIHKLPLGGGNDLIDPVRKSQACIGSEVPVMLRGRLRGPLAGRTS